jgi:hypothetical protein
MNKKEFLEYLKKKVFSLKNTSCYFLTTLTLSLPD